MEELKPTLGLVRTSVFPEGFSFIFSYKLIDKLKGITVENEKQVTFL